MAESPAYVVLGAGRWADKIHSILSGENRCVLAMGDTRPQGGESETEFKLRLCSSLMASGAKFAWLCDLPSPHTRWMIESAMHAGLHAIVEKPWLFSPAETHSLKEQAKTSERILGVHYQYCLLEAVEKWKRDFFPGAGLQFGGRFAVSRPGYSGIAAIDNLGCHLLAIRQYAVPSAQISEISCSYESPDERLVWLEKGDERLAFINFVRNKEPIIQRFMKKAEAALEGAAFPFDLDFALRVTSEINAFKSGNSA